MTLLSFYKIPRSAVVLALRGIHNLKGLRVVDTYRFGYALENFENRSVKYIDALIASIEELARRKWVVISYDKDFDKLGVIRKEPKEIVSS